MNVRAKRSAVVPWSVAVVALAHTGAAHGQAAVENSAAPSIWFRSSEGCPDGEAFLARLRGAASGARLAGAGDRIDFVVTLGAHGNQSSGRLERQTSGGTVAVRELTATSCEDVADALALTLGLALDPAASSASARAESRSSDVSKERTFTPQPPPPVAAPATTAEQNAGASARPSPLSAGGQFGLLSRALPSQALSIGAFVEYRPLLAALPRASTRVTAFGAWSDRSAAPAIDTNLLALRLELCPTALLLGRVELAPCLGAEAGRIAAETPDSTRSDGGIWSALVGHARVRFELVPSVVVEAQAGGVVPLVRYAFHGRTTGDELLRAETLGISASAGIALGLP